jgi:hypothetical protein
VVSSADYSEEAGSNVGIATPMEEETDIAEENAGGMSSGYDNTVHSLLKFH